MEPREVGDMETRGEEARRRGGGGKEMRGRKQGDEGGEKK